MDSMSLELLEMVLSSPVLNDRDVLNFSSTCHHFRNILLTNQMIWKRRFYKKLPNLSDSFWCPDSYFDELKYFYSLKTKVLDMLESVFVGFFTQSISSDVDLSEWEMICNEKEQHYFYLSKHLLDIINTQETIKSVLVVPFNTPGNLTFQFFARFILRMLNETYLRNTWRKFRCLPPEQQTFEKVAIFFAQWFQLDPKKVEHYITKQLDDIANLVKIRLKSTNPKHPIFTTMVGQGRSEKLEKHKWGPENCQVIISTICDILYSDLKLQGNFYLREYTPDYYFINKVLEGRKGVSTTLAVIYKSVARRLGVLVELINVVDEVPDYYNDCQLLLKFQLNESIYFIDPCSGDFTDGVQCGYKFLYSGDTNQSASTIDEFVQHMTDKLILIFQKMRHEVRQTHFLNSIQSLCEHFGNFNVKSPINRLYPICEKSKRPICLKYAVGMVVVDRHTGMKCVICGWKKIENHMPIYIAVREDGLTLWDYEEYFREAITDPGNLLSTEQVGFYFSHFFENHFVPNVEVEKLFPCDAQVRHKFYLETHLLNYRP